MRFRLICLAAAALALVPAASSAVAAKPPKAQRPFPWHKRVREATNFLAGRAGSASFAVADERGRIHGYQRGVQYSSASLVKAMILVAYLRRKEVRRRGLNPAERHLLGPMIRLSDNDAASAVYATVGPDDLTRLADRAGMRRFAANPVWGGCQVTARDQARFFLRLHRLLPDRHRKYGLGLLRSIDPSQRWGIPPAIPGGWGIYFKGGWFPDDDGGWRVHQAALLRKGNRRIAIAVLTQRSPSLEYGAATITGLTSRLLRGYR